MGSLIQGFHLLQEQAWNDAFQTLTAEAEIMAWPGQSDLKPWKLYWFGLSTKSSWKSADVHVTRMYFDIYIVQIAYILGFRYRT